MHPLEGAERKGTESGHQEWDEGKREGGGTVVEAGSDREQDKKFIISTFLGGITP